MPPSSVRTAAKTAPDGSTASELTPWLPGSAWLSLPPPCEIACQLSPASSLSRTVASDSRVQGARPLGIDHQRAERIRAECESGRLPGRAAVCRLEQKGVLAARDCAPDAAVDRRGVSHACVDGLWTRGRNRERLDPHEPALPEHRLPAAAAVGALLDAAAAAGPDDAAVGRVDCERAHPSL